MRGEQGTVHDSFPIVLGSAPRARGAVVGWLVIHAVLWISPACAGSRFGPEVFCHFSADQPRVRGEQVCVYFVTRTSTGSAPRAFPNVG